MPSNHRHEDDHDPRYCGHRWESSCESCRKDYWPERYFTSPAEARPFLPRQPLPYPTQPQLIRSMHHFRHKSAMRWAMMDLLFPDLVELIDERVEAIIEARIAARRKA